MEYSYIKNEKVALEKLRKHIRAIAIVYLLFGLFAADLGILLPSDALQRHKVDRLGIYALSGVYCSVAFGLFRFNPIARLVCYFTSLPFLLLFPVGTIIGIYSFYYLTAGKKLFRFKGKVHRTNEDDVFLDPLKNCPGCEREVSPSCRICPRCGHRFDSPSNES
jgi:hypothetical protein